MSQLRCPRSQGAGGVSCHGHDLMLGCWTECLHLFVRHLQNLKDSLIVTNLGAETLPFLASFGVLPLSVAFMGFYNKLVSQKCALRSLVVKCESCFCAAVWRSIHMPPFILLTIWCRLEVL